jgi:hypothetical protein
VAALVAVTKYPHVQGTVMVQVFANVLDHRALKDLRDYFSCEDRDRDQRPDVISKSPSPDSEAWPGFYVRHALRQILPQAFSIEEILFHQSWTRYHLHADTGRGREHQKLYKAVLFPLEFTGTSGTTFFQNHWHGPSAKFTKQPFLKYQYWLPDRSGGKTWVEDLRVVKDQAQQGDAALDRIFSVDHDFISMLDYLITKRNDESILRHLWISEYNEVEGVSDAVFPEHLRLAYCEHVPAEDLHGLTFDQYVPWQLGSAIVFDRTQIHCTGNGDLGKLGLTVFTNLV